MSALRSIAAITLALLVSGACRPRFEQRWFGRCYEVPADTIPLGAVSLDPAGASGELRVRALPRDTTQPYRVILARTDSAAPDRRVDTDSVAVFRDVAPGTYRMDVRALVHSPRFVEASLGRDSGRAIVVPLRYGGVGVGEDGIETVRRPWWRIW